MSAFDTLNRSGLAMLGERSTETSADRVKAYIGNVSNDPRMAFAYVRGLLSGGTDGFRLACVACDEFERLQVLGRAA